MTDVTDIYYIIDFQWNWDIPKLLSENEAKQQLADWKTHVPERINKISALLEFDKTIDNASEFSSSDLRKLEQFIFREAKLSQRFGRDYLDDFTFELCKDSAALLGELCHVQDNSLSWVINNDPESGFDYQAIGMKSVSTGEHFAIPYLICEYIREELVSGRKGEYDFLLKLMALITFQENLTN